MDVSEPKTPAAKDGWVWLTHHLTEEWIIVHPDDVRGMYRMYCRDDVTVVRIRHFPTEIAEVTGSIGEIVAAVAQARRFVATGNGVTWQDQAAPRRMCVCGHERDTHDRDGMCCESEPQRCTCLRFVATAR